MRDGVATSKFQSVCYRPIFPGAGASGRDPPLVGVIRSTIDLGNRPKQRLTLSLIMLRNSE